ncbi:MAG: MFS transporter [Thermomicrobiales bacterium]
MRLPPRWVIAVSIAVAASILGDSLLYAVLPTTYDDLGLQAFMVGILLSANRFVRLLTNTLAGWTMARKGVRGPFLTAVFIAALTTALYASGLGFAVFLIARLGWGLCWSFLRLGGYLAALEAADDRSRGYYLGFFSGVTRFGSFVAALVGGFMTDLIGFTTTIVAFTVLTIIGGLGVIRERPPRVSTDLVSRPDAKPLQPEALAEDAMRDRLWIVYVMVLLQAMAVQGLVTSTLGSWLQDNYGDDISLAFITIGVASLTGTLLSVRFLSEFLWGPVAGHLSDRHGRVRLLLIAGGIEIAGLIGLAIAPGVWAVIGMSIVLFLSATAAKVTLDALAGDLAPPDRRSQTMSTYATWSDLGSAAGPLIGWIIGIGIGLNWMYLGSATTLAIIGSLFLITFGRQGSLATGPQNGHA